MCFFKSTLATKSQANDIQVHFIPMNPKNTEQTKRNMGFDPDKFVQMDGSLGPDRGVTFLPSLLQPKSEGFIELNSSNPLDHPIIEPNYLAHPDDVEVMCQAFEFCRRAGKTPAMQRLLNPEETYDTSIQHDPNSREYVKAKVQRDLITIYHPTSTCKMGPASNPLAVLDPASLRVRGVAGLRVVDCASMPDVPAANTNLPAIMLALRAGELIAQSWVQ
jgi:choline dehydrogenase